MSGSTIPRAATDQRHDSMYAPSPEISSRQQNPRARPEITALRILHIDDEPDIREVVELSLTLDPAFIVRSCASGGEALAVVLEWPPDLILCDVMMPVMDGPTTLARLRENPKTAQIPVVFMTARAQKRELEHFKSLGAAGVISKPFDPMMLAASLRKHIRAAGLSALRGGFLRRLQADAACLAAYRLDLADVAARAAALQQIKNFAHALAGASGIFGFQEISRAASELEKFITEGRCGNGALATVEQALDELLRRIESLPAAGTT